MTSTIFLLRTQRGGILPGVAYASAEAALSDALSLPADVGWTRAVEVPLLASPEAVAAYRDQQAAEAAAAAEQARSAPLSFTISGTGEVK